MSSSRVGGALALGGLCFAVVLDGIGCATAPSVRTPMIPEGVAGPASSPASSFAPAAPSALAAPAAPSAEPSSVPDPLLEYGRPPDPACIGTSLTFGSLSPCKCSGNHEPPGVLRAGVHCAPAFYQRDLTALLETDIVAPSARVRAGATTTVEIILRNVGAVRLPVVVNAFPVHDVQIIDGRGRDVAIDGGCGQGFSGFGTDYLVTLEPGGRAYFAIPWRAVSRNLCNGIETPLPKGRYQVRLLLGHVFDLPQSQAVRETTLDVD